MPHLTPEDLVQGEEPPRSWWRGLFVMLLVLGAISVAGYFGYQEFRSYRYEQTLAQAHEAIDKGKREEALFLLRVLVANYAPSDRTFSALAKFAAGNQMPEAMAWLRDAIQLNPEQPEYRVALVVAQIQFGRLGEAAETLAQWPESSQDGAAFHRAASALAFARGDWPAAVKAAERIIELDGAVPVNVVNLAKMRLQLGDESLAQQAREELQSQVNDPVIGWEARKALIQDALRRQDQALANQMVDQLRQVDRKLFEQDFFLLEAAHLLKQPTWREDLSRTQKRWAKQPQAVARLVAFLSNVGLAPEALAWSEQLDPLVVTSYPAAFAIGEAQLIKGDFTKVHSMLGGRGWSEKDYLRRLLVARADELLSGGKSATAGEQLRSSFEQASRERGGLANVERVLLTWRWQEPLEALWWEMIRQRDGIRRAVPALNRLYDQLGDTDGLRRVAGAEVDLNPGNPVARNNYAYLSLLLNEDTERASRMASELWKQYPDRPSLASTWALALLKQGKADEASSVLASIPSVDQESAALRLLRGLALSQSGRSGEGERLLDAVDVAQLLPEEKQLLLEGRSMSREA